MFIQLARYQDFRKLSSIFLELILGKVANVVLPSTFILTWRSQIILKIAKALEIKVPYIVRHRRRAQIFHTGAPGDRQGVGGASPLR